MSQYERQFFEYFQLLDRKRLSQPLVLGGIMGSGGGVGYPPGGYSGQLPQTQVCYDLSEDATLDTTTSGESLLDNLNHIRYRIGDLEEDVAILISASGSGGGGGVLSIYDDTVLQGIATELDFSTGITATVSSGRVTIVGTESGSNINKIIRTNSGNTTTYEEYDKTSAGLLAAIEDKALGDVITIPPGEYTIDQGIDVSGVYLIGSGKDATFLYITTLSTDTYGVINDAGYYGGIIKDMTIDVYSLSELPALSYYFGGVFIDRAGIENVNISATYQGTAAGMSYFSALHFDTPLDAYGDSRNIISNVSIYTNMGYGDDTPASVGIYYKGSSKDIILDTFDIYVYNDYGGEAYGIYIDQMKEGAIIRNGTIRVERSSDYQDGNSSVFGIYTYTYKPTIDNVSIYLEAGFDNTLDNANPEYCPLKYIAIGTTHYSPEVKKCVFDLFIDTADATDLGVCSLIRTVGDLNVTNCYGVVKYDNSIENTPTTHYFYIENGGTGFRDVRVKNSAFETRDTNSPYGLISEGSSSYNDEYVKSFNSSFNGITTNTEGFYSGDVVGGNYISIDDSGVLTLHGDASIPGTDVYENSVSKGEVHELDFTTGFNVSVDGDRATISMDLASGGGASEVASDAIWDNKGDLAVGTGANTAAILASGSDGQNIVVDSTTSTGLAYVTGARVLISEQTPTGTSVSFTSIPSKYTHLIIEFIARSDRSGQVSETLQLQFNGDTTATNYYYENKQAYDTTSSASEGDSNIIAAIPGATALSGNPGIGSIYIPYYKETTFNKGAIATSTERRTATTQYIRLISMFWEAATAISQINIATGNGSNYISGSIFRLYGVY